MGLTFHVNLTFLARYQCLRGAASLSSTESISSDASSCPAIAARWFLEFSPTAGRKEDLQGPFVSGSRPAGSRILSTAGRKIRYRFPSSKLSTRHVWVATQNAIRHTRTALASYVRNFGRSLVCAARIILSRSARTRAHREIHRYGWRNRLKDVRPLKTSASSIWLLDVARFTFSKLGWS